MTRMSFEKLMSMSDEERIRWWHNGKMPENLEQKQCEVEGCNRTTMSKTKKYCETHLARWRKYGDVRAHIPIKSPHDVIKKAKCAVEGCDRLVRSSTKKYCKTHQERLEKHGDTLAHIPIGAVRKL